MGASGGKKTFYFVNKSEASAHLSKSSHHETVAIQRHVQTGRKRGRIPQRVKTSATLHDSSSSAVLIEPKLRSADFGTDSEQSAPSRRRSEGLQKSKSVHQPAVHETQWCRASLMAQRNLYGRDPFDASSVPINNSVAGLLHYYMYYYHPSQWPNEMALLRQGVYVFEDAMMQILRAAIADKMTMHCLLSAAACRLQFVDRLPCPLVVGVERRHILSALRYLSSYIANANLQDPVQLNYFLTCLGFLNSAEAYRGELSAARTHLDAAVRLLKPIGGISALNDEPLQGQFAMGDLFLACVDLRPCYFDCSWDPGPAEYLELENTEWGAPYVATEACSLLERSQSFVSPEMEKIIKDLVESHTVKNRIVISSMQPSRAKRITHWITLRNMAIRHRLLAYQTSDTRLHSLRIAVVMWTLLTMNITGRAKTVKLMAPRLKASLCEESQLHWAGNEDIRLWVLLVGAYCADDGSDTLRWFVSECRSLMPCCIPVSTANACTIDLADRLEIFQHRFFYDSQAQSMRTRTLADKLRHSSTSSTPN